MKLAILAWVLAISSFFVYYRVSKSDKATKKRVILIGIPTVTVVILVSYFVFMYYLEDVYATAINFFPKKARGSSDYEAWTPLHWKICQNMFDQKGELEGAQFRHAMANLSPPEVAGICRGAAFRA